LYVLGVIVGLSIFATALNYSDGCLFPSMIALYSVGRYVSNDRWSYIGLGSAITFVVLSSIASMFATNSYDVGTDLLLSILIPYLVWYMGRRIRIRGDYLKLLQERALQLEREQDREARRAVAEERARIAREMHDVVAHQVSLMTVQAGAAKTVAVDDPQSALHAMEAVENAGRQALYELRHLIGILRPEAEDGDLDPQRSLADVPRLVEQLTKAGLDVSLTMDDACKDVPTRVGLSVYRIIQEALTNVLKHGGPGVRAEVRLSTNNDNVVIEVLDNGHGFTILPGSGHGIAGMRERAQLLGGSLDAGPCPDGGFRVIARLPIGGEPT
jgi:signal transduction histidine kinase